MYFIVGKCINQGKHTVSYIITDGEGIKEVTPQQVYIEYQHGNIPYLNGFNTNTGELDFKNIDNTLIPTFYNGRSINNSVSVLKVLEENGKQIGVRILVASGKIINIRISEIIQLANSNKIQLFNAKIVNDKIVMKYKSDNECSDNTTLEHYNKDEFIIDNNVLVKYRGHKNKVKIPNGVVSIGKEAFIYSHCLESVVIPNSVKSIEEDAFAYCEKLTSVSIPDSVTSVEKEAFWACKNLTDVTIGDGLASIGERAFCNCDIKNISIGKALTTLYSNIFFNSVNIKIDPENKYFYAKNNIIYSKDGKILLLCARRKEGEVIIPNGVEIIGEDAFHNCGRVTSIHMPNSVTSIEKRAFGSCNRLASINISDNVKKIGDSAFFKCEKLVSIKIPSSVTSIGEGVFGYCEGLKEIIIGDNISIGEAAFYECSRLADDKRFVIINNILYGYFGTDKEVIIPEGVKCIGRRAFLNNYSMKFLTIPSSVTSIRDWAFFGCSQLRSVDIPDGLKDIPDNAFMDCRRLKNLPIHGYIIDGSKCDWKKMDTVHPSELGLMIDNKDYSMKIDRTFKFQIIVQIFLKDKQPEAEAYIRKNILNLMNYFIDINDYDTVKALFESGKFVTKRNIDKFVERAKSHGNRQINEYIKNYNI